MPPSDFCAVAQCPVAPQPRISGYSNGRKWTASKEKQLLAASYFHIDRILPLMSTEPRGRADLSWRND